MRRASRRIADLERPVSSAAASNAFLSFSLRHVNVVLDRLVSAGNLGRIPFFAPSLL